MLEIFTINEYVKLIFSINYFQDVDAMLHFRLTCQREVPYPRVYQWLTVPFLYLIKPYLIATVITMLVTEGLDPPRPECMPLPGPYVSTPATLTPEH